jgi:multidrug efflux pump subunit AcrA (membrane-fusion protein)
MPQPKPARKRPPKKRRRRRATTRRALPLVPVLLGVAAVAAVAFGVLSVGSDSQPTSSERIVTVSQGVVQSIVSGSGNLEPANQLNVNFATSGQITKIYVKEGDHVSKGDLLAKLDNASQQVDLAQAQAQLVDARDALTKAADAADTSSATATQASTTGRTVAVAAQATPSPSPTASPSPSPSATPRATATPRAGATPTQTPSSGGSNSSGGSTQSVESASAAVQSAELAVKQAQDALDATSLRAPATGTVASIANQVGDTVGSSQNAAASSSAFIVLAQLSKLKMEVALSESDIGDVEVGQKATVTINAASGEEVAAHVSEIGVLSSASDSSSSQDNGSSSGAVSYPVTVALDQTTDGVRAGMSATADIVTSQASGVVVPSQALRGNTVTLVANGERTTERVQTGVVGDSTTQVVSGLKAGDRVVITSTSAAAGGATTGAGGQNRFGGGGFGGFGGGGAFPGGGGGGFRRGG